jgi:hypothetical protein
MLTITRVNYHGWPDSYLIRNGVVEAVVVPAIGRVMQFRWAGEEQGVFWVNRVLDGKLPDPKSNDWANFGGEKSWPAPQADWEKVTGRAWPPPAAFDSLPMETKVGRDEITLASKVDSRYGMQIVRRIRLDPALPHMAITTEYHKVSGDPIGVGIWVVAQVRDPQRVYALLSAKSQPAGAFEQLMGAAPKELKIKGQLLSLERDSQECSKIGMDGSSLLWMDGDSVLRMDAADAPGEDPRGGGRIEVYTNPDPLPYVELETAGALTSLRAGDRLERTNTYTLMRRSTPDAAAEAAKAFGL